MAFPVHGTLMHLHHSSFVVPTQNNFVDIDSKIKEQQAKIPKRKSGPIAGGKWVEAEFGVNSQNLRCLVVYGFKFSAAGRPIVNERQRWICIKQSRGGCLASSYTENRNVKIFPLHVSRQHNHQ